MATNTQGRSIILVILGLIALALGLLFIFGSISPVGHPKETTKNSYEPLADVSSLSRLIAGNTLPKPKEESYAEFLGTKPSPLSLNSLKSASRVLGTTAPSDKRIEVDLTNQRVYAFEGSRKVYEFVVSTGKWWPTPTGEFDIWVKVRSQRMTGGSKELGTYYYLPNVPYVMFFYNSQVPKMSGYSLHGAYWHNNFGHPMSHGCINMRIEDSKLLYEWADPTVTNAQAWATYPTAQNPGTKVIIYGETPRV